MSTEETIDDLTPKEREQFSRIRFRRTGEENKYLRKFDTKIETFRFLQKVKRRYAHGGKDSNNLTELCEEYEREGIKMYPAVLSKWLQKAFEIKIQWGRDDRPTKRIPVSVSMSKDVYEIYSQIGDVFSRSEYLDMIYRMHAGLPFEGLILWIGDDDYPVSVLFWIDKTNGECQALSMVSLDKSTRKFVESLCQDAEMHDLQYVKTKCRALGYHVFGCQPTEE